MRKIAKICVVLTVGVLLGLAPAALVADPGDDGNGEDRRPTKRVLNRDLGGNPPGDDASDGGEVEHGTEQTVIDLGVEKRGSQPRLDEKGTNGNGGGNHRGRHRGKKKGGPHDDEGSDDEDPDDDEDGDQTPVGP